VKKKRTAGVEVVRVRLQGRLGCTAVVQRCFWGRRPCTLALTGAHRAYPANLYMTAAMSNITNNNCHGTAEVLD